MYKRLLLIVWMCLVLITAGCSIPQLPGGEDRPEKPQQQAKKSAARAERPVPGQVEVGQVPVGQKDNPVLTPEEHGVISAGMQETISLLVEGMRVKDLSKAESCFYGLDEDGSVITLEQLQHEVELLHPVEWRVHGYRTAGRDEAVVDVSFTMPDGAVRRASPFSMLNEGDAWSVHFNSFAASFHEIAVHMPGESNEQPEETAALWD